MKMTVITVFNRQYLEPELTQQDFPAGVEGRLMKSSAGLDSIKDTAVLLMTDRPDLVKAFVNRDLKNSLCVYIGDPSDIESVLDKVTDVWSSFDDGRVLRKRALVLTEYMSLRPGMNY